MAIILQTSDFKGGKYDIQQAGSNQNTLVTSVQEAIASHEKPAIYELLGVTLGNLLITYIPNALTTPNTDYDKIIAAFSDDSSGCLYQSLGLKEFLKAWVFFEYTRNGLKTTQLGVAQPKAETGDQVGPAGTLRFAESKFNDILDTAEAIQWYCSTNRTAFPDYKGQQIRVKMGGIL